LDIPDLVNRLREEVEGFLGWICNETVMESSGKGEGWRVKAGNEWRNGVT